jgi:hypothetical protein
VKLPSDRRFDDKGVETEAIGPVELDWSFIFTELTVTDVFGLRESGRVVWSVLPSGMRL